MLWGSFRNRWLVTGTLMARTALRVGAGSESYDPTATDLPVVKDLDGHPYIPGSSLKGVIRSRLEQIVRALEPGPSEAGAPWGGRGACDPLAVGRGGSSRSDRGACISREAAEQAKRERPDDWPREAFERACRTCRLFGSPWLAGRVLFADLPCQPPRDEDLTTGSGGVVTETRDGVAIDRDKGTVAEGAKYDFEVVTAGSRFRMEIVGENLLEDGLSNEPGLILLGLWELRNGLVRLGGFKSRGLGAVEVVDLRVCRVTAPVDEAGVDAYVRHLFNKPLTPLSDEEMASRIRQCVSVMMSTSQGGDSGA